MKIVSFNVNGIRARMHQLEAIKQQLNALFTQATKRQMVIPYILLMAIFLKVKIAVTILSFQLSKNITLTYYLT